MALLSYSAAGLICDAAGAAIVMRTFVFASDARTLAFSHSGEHTASQLAYEACGQRIDARFGFPLLIVGFVLQLAGLAAQADYLLFPALVIAATGVALAYYGLMRDLHASEDSARALAIASKRHDLAAAAAQVPAPPRLHLVEAASA